MRELFRFAADTGAGGSASSDGNTGEAGQVPETWDAFVGTLPDQVKALYEQHIQGLTNTVQATRQERDALKQRIDAMVGALDGKEPEALKTQVLELQKTVSDAVSRASFFEEASKPEIGCRNPKLAYLVATADQLFDRRGLPDWEAIKRSAPELFGTVTPPGNAGSGTVGSQSTRVDMNTIIRRAAGRE